MVGMPVAKNIEMIPSIDRNICLDDYTLDMAHIYQSLQLPGRVYGDPWSFLKTESYYMDDVSSDST